MGRRKHLGQDHVAERRRPFVATGRRRVGEALVNRDYRACDEIDPTRDADWQDGLKIEVVHPLPALRQGISGLELVIVELKLERPQARDGVVDVFGQVVTRSGDSRAPLRRR
jgi:hypothetical protein